MPELPEVESTKNELSSFLKEDFLVKQISFSSKRLRFQTPKKVIEKKLPLNIVSIVRRAKYLLIQTDKGVLLSHLGMSGSWRREVGDSSLVKTHDHVTLSFSSGASWVYNDPRRFGAFDWISGESYQQHLLLKNLGPEPLSDEFTGEYLFKVTRKKSVAIKTLIMNQKVVVGVGNIYAVEALFAAGIKPNLKSFRLTQAGAQILVQKIKSTLEKAIAAGGSTIQSFEINNRLGSYQDHHQVYGRNDQQCVVCGSVIRHTYQNGRSTYWCPSCQK